MPSEIRIVPLHAFGNRKMLRVMARVVKGPEPDEPSEENTTWQNIMAMVRRYRIRPVKNARVSVSLPHREKVIIATDDLGYIRPVFSLDEDIELKELKIGLSLTDHPEVTAEMRAVVGRESARFGIISDIDDTVLVSHSTKLFRKLRLMLFKNATTRIPFKGVATFYQALMNIDVEGYDNPMFYVSSSEWSLLDLLEDFFRYHGIPVGTFMLHSKEIDIWKVWRSGRGKHEHKYDKIREVLETHFELPFILIGDSGQRDPFIYRRAAMEFPGRIKAIYIREVSHQKKLRKLRELTTAMEIELPEILFIEDTLKAAGHAADKGYIDPKHLKSIEEEITLEKKKESAN